MTGLPKHIIKKYGVTKKAWQVFRGKKSSKKSTSRVKYKSTRLQMAKKKTKAKKQTILGKLNNPLLGAAGVVTYESLISPLIPVQGIAKDMLELVAGLWMSKKKGILGATGKSLVMLNSYQLVSNIAKPLIQNYIPDGNNASNDYFNY